MDTGALKEIGFTDNEVKVYLELLGEKEALASDLAKKAGINRTLCYQVLGGLSDRGIVGYVIKNNTKYFRAMPPDKLLDFLKEREINVRALLPELLRIKTPVREEYSAELLEGKEGIKTVLEDIVRTKPKEFCDLTAGLAPQIISELYSDKWEEKRAKARIRARFLVNDTAEGRARAKAWKTFKLSEVRLLPKGFETPCHIYLYGNKTAIFVFSKEHPFGVLIVSREIHDRFIEFFEWFWKGSKEA